MTGKVNRLAEKPNHLLYSSGSVKLGIILFISHTTYSTK